MGQDNKSDEFHQALRNLIQDPEPMVRWNTALALARFADPAGRDQLRLMLRPYLLVASEAGMVSFRVKEADAVRNGSVVARIETGDRAQPVEVRSPVAGQVERRTAREGAKVAAGSEIAIVSPAEEQVWESLRALYLVGGADDLEDVERFAVSRMSERLRQQAALTAQAIRRRTVTSHE